MKQILVIDDEAHIRKMLRKLLEGNGYKVCLACDGEDGLAQFKTHLPDLVITDLIMPEKEGLETIREIRKITSDTKIIAISGGGISQPDMYLHMAESFGAQAVFKKPVDTEVLVAEVAKLLDEAP
ncbi:MAG: response regulator [Desulfobacterales bacterium]|nr:response regulator [Desulfobacterales bacterium]